MGGIIAIAYAFCAASANPASDRGSSSHLIMSRIISAISCALWACTAWPQLPAII